MLALNSLLATLRRRDQEHESGAALIAVVVVMFVGAIIASTIAASVVFTVGANEDNKRYTQAFISAESGRDAALSSLKHAIDPTTGKFNCGAVGTGPISGTGPAYTYNIRWSNATSIDTATWSGSSTACPTNSTNFVLIESSGIDATSTSKVRATYPWRLTHIEQPAGTMAYFDGEFKATKSTYTGDLVVRGTLPYTCNNDSVIEGDLWVVRSSVVLSTDCTVTGSIYAFGTVSSSSSGVSVGGDIIAGGAVTMDSNGVTVAGQIYSGGAVNLQGTGSSSGIVGHMSTDAATCTAAGKAAPCLLGGAVTSLAPTPPVINAKWKHADGTAIIGTTGPAPVFSPTLNDVFNATKWLELASGWGAWGSSSSTPTTTLYQTCNEAVIIGQLADATAGRAFFDMSACLSPNNKVVNVTLDQPGITIARDAVFYVPASKQMNLQITAPVTKVGDPQLVFAHADGNAADAAPTTCAQGLDSITISANIQPRTMIYSPCGLNGNVSVTLTGQLYTANSGTHLVLADFTCAPMGWLPAFGTLSCGIKGDGGAFDTSKDIVSIDPLAAQIENPTP